MIASVLVANRGEIACRILRTVRRLGMRGIAVYHFADRNAPHVAMADEALELTGSVPTAAYLDQAQIIQACLRAGVDSVHPGYGFLAENAAFAEAVAAAGLVFVGPDADTIRLMGDKIASRNFARAQNVPVAPSATDEGDPTAFLRQAAAIGFPLLIKASAGGGGKGMKIVRSADELQENIRVAASEALRYFGDGRVYAEKLVEAPRHIEVQVLGDGEGSVIHLHERECSIQRRHQKVIEEAPAPRLPPSVKNAICDAAVRLATAARYRNAGTIEFILGADGAFYFLEMNTRLQVEHPVTEEIVGLDLVEEQLRIADGKGLSRRQDEIRISGHSIEVRICAEQPERDFRPATGVCGVLRWPADARVEAGVAEGQEVTAAFDSMLAKIITTGSTRLEAADRMKHALDEFVLLGVPNNADYLARIVAHEAFREGRLDTNFLVEHSADLLPAQRAPEPAAILAALMADAGFRRVVDDVPALHAAIGRWRN
ncbi:MAG: biotin carboxylase [Enterovirga sp.]|nr:biotin carboxylase [Enterovirga sp.]